MHKRPIVYIGYDPDEHSSHEVCSFSIKTGCPEAVVNPLIQGHLRETGFYWREHDKNASTAFSITRFLVPELMNFSGLAIFCDSDIIFTEDVCHLLDYMQDESKAVGVVKHNYQPIQIKKKDGATQINYPKKNWSSLVVFNCGHPKNKNLTKEVVNSVHPSFLHQFQWLDDDDIVDIHYKWNFLVGYHKKLDGVLPSAIHFTEGGPWLNQHKDVDYADLWFELREKAPNIGYLEYGDFE